MRVLIVTRASIGGAARHVLDVVTGLAPRHDLTVLASPREDPAFLGRLADAGAEVLDLPIARRPSPAHDVAALARVRSVIRRGGFDVVHAHAAKAGAFVRFGPRTAGIVYSPHGFYHHYPTALGAARGAARVAERLLARRADVLALCATWEVRAAARERLVPRRETVTIPNGVPLPPPAPREERDRLRAELGVPADGTLVLMVGRLKPPKDPGTFLRAARLLCAEARFVLVGDGPLLGRCRAQAPRGALVAGPRPDVPLLLASADVAVLATDFEAAPYFLLEAMASGLPAVASDVPGTREILEDAGLLVPPGDADRLADAVRTLTRDDAARHDLGARGRARVVERHSPARMLEATERAWRAAAR